MNRRRFLFSSAFIATATATGWISNATAMQSNPHNHAHHAGEGPCLSSLKKDADPLSHELEAYPTCTYCGMSREKWSHSRHLVQYDDDHCEATCSIRCLAVSLSLHLDRGPKSIWVGDAGSDATVKPLLNAEEAFYAFEKGKPGTMTANRKGAYASREAAFATGGVVMTFDEALEAAYQDLATDTIRTRKRRAEKRARKHRKASQTHAH